jgi:hypothetical protein
MSISEWEEIFQVFRTNLRAPLKIHFFARHPAKAGIHIPEKFILATLIKQSSSIWLF